MNNNLLKLKKQLIEISKPTLEDKISNYFDKLGAYLDGESISVEEVIEAFENIKR